MPPALEPVLREAPRWEPGAAGREEIAERILLIRFFEESLDALFEKGVIHGTYHRCTGQEATAVGVVRHLDPVRDYVVSNHRNHGHYLAFTGDFAGLYAELRGDPEGVTGGRGGSQVLFAERFLSNGILGSTVPLATGIALGLKRRGQGGCAVCFLGDGALCEGAVYEALNMAALWKLPILYVLEWNGVAQSAAIEAILAGSALERFTAFGIPATRLCSTDVFEVTEAAGPLLERVRSGAGPAALVVEAERLCAHSKGDDPRGPEALAAARAADPVALLRRSVPGFEEIAARARARIHELALGGAR